MSDINRKLGPNNESYRSLVAILANKRIQKGLSQYELAKRAGVAHTTIPGLRRSNMCHYFLRS